MDQTNKLKAGTAVSDIEIANRESEDRFQAAMTAVGGIVWTNTASGMMEGEQPSWGAFTGQTPEQYHGFGWTNAIHPEDAQSTLAAWKMAVAEKRLFRIEHRVRGHAGDWRWFSVRAMPVIGGQGEIREWIGVHTDITDHRQAEQALRESEQHFRNLADNLPQLAWIAEVHTNGQVDWFNRTWLTYTGTTLEEMRGSGWQRVHHPDHAARVIEKFERHVREGLDWEDTFPLRRADGEYRWFLSRMKVIRNSAGKVTKLFGTNTDISAQRELEVALRESREFTRQVLDNLYAFVGVLTVDGTLIEVNRAPLEAAGISPSEVLGKKFWNSSWWSYSPAVQARLRAACERAAAGEVVRYDVPVRIAGDKILWIDFQLAPLKNTEGRVTHLIPSGMDISERRRSAETLRQNAELFVRLVDQAPTGMYVVDADFRMQQVNALAEPVFAKVDPLIGRDFGEVIAVIWGPDVGAEVARIFRHTLDTGERYVSQGFVNERYDIGGEQAYEWQTQRVTLADGRYGVVCYFEDVTERNRADRAIRESETRLRLATEATSVGIWEWNLLSGRVHWDAQMFRLYGIAPIEDGRMTYSTWRRAVLPEDLPECERILNDTVRRSGQSRREFRIRRGDDGQVRDIEAVETVRTNGLGQGEWIVGTNLDITDRKRATEALQKSHTKVEAALRSKDDFLAALSHELRTPLTPVLLIATELERERGLSEEVRGQLSMIRRNVELEVQLIDDLLDLTRIRHGKLQIAPLVTDIHQLLNYTAEIVGSESRGKQVRTVFQLEAGRSYAMVDPTRFQQVFWNVIKNAIKFTPPGGSVVVRTANDAGGRIVVSVQDTGIGISAEALAHIFNAFDQGDVAGQHRYGGLGLGLAIARAVVETHHGAIRADSEGLGHGATFTIAVDTVVPPGAIALAEPPEQVSIRVLRLLLVEDHETSRTVLTHLLSRRGHTVTTAATVQEALTCFGAAPFDAVISDLGLPDGSGLDLIREMQRQRPVFAIALSGYGMEEDVRQAKEAGFAAHLVKPVKADKLFQLLGQVAATS
ncbi:MAG: PAS domain S-box protein [Opitutaceae bacterium]